MRNPLKEEVLNFIKRWDAMEDVTPAVRSLRAAAMNPARGLLEHEVEGIVYKDNTVLFLHRRVELYAKEMRACVEEVGGVQGGTLLDAIRRLRLERDALLKDVNNMKEKGLTL